MYRRMLVILLVLAAVGCSASLRLGDKQFANMPQNSGMLQLSSNVKDADVYLDGQMIGSITGARQDFVVPGGNHELVIRKYGYKPYQANIRVVEGARNSMQVYLERETGATGQMYPQSQTGTPSGGAGISAEGSVGAGSSGSTQR